MKIKTILQLVVIICFISLNLSSLQCQSALRIWFTRPVENWNEALPVGNGKPGAMIFGGIENERIQLNEESVWTGLLKILKQDPW